MTAIQAGTRTRPPRRPVLAGAGGPAAAVALPLKVMTARILFPSFVKLPV